MGTYSDITGYSCPKCGSKTLVMDSRLDEHGIRRRRYCKESECGHRFTTLETEFASHRELTATPIARMLRAAADAIEGLGKP